MNLCPLKRPISMPFTEYKEKRAESNLTIKRHLRGYLIKVTEWPNRKEKAKLIKIARGRRNEQI